MPNDGPPSPPELMPGAWFSASWLNMLLAFLRSCRVKRSASVLVDYAPDGQTIRVNIPQEADFRISGGTNPYAGTEVFAVVGGTWQTRAESRVVTGVIDPLYERNNNKQIDVDTVVHARRDVSSGLWIFDRARCSGGVVPPALPPTSPTPAPAPNPAPLPPSPAPIPSPPTKPAPTPAPPSTPTPPTTPLPTRPAIPAEPPIPPAMPPLPRPTDPTPPYYPPAYWPPYVPPDWVPGGGVIVIDGGTTSPGYPRPGFPDPRPNGGKTDSPGQLQGYPRPLGDLGSRPLGQVNDGTSSHTFGP